MDILGEDVRGLDGASRVKVADLTKDRLEQDAPGLFSQDPDGRLALVTSSRYRLGAYAKSTVVLAQPA